MNVVERWVPKAARPLASPVLSGVHLNRRGAVAFVCGTPALACAAGAMGSKPESMFQRSGEAENLMQIRALPFFSIGPRAAIAAHAICPIQPFFELTQAGT